MVRHGGHGGNASQRVSETSEDDSCQNGAVRLGRHDGEVCAGTRANRYPCCDRVFDFGANLHPDFPTLFVAFVVGTLAFNALGYLFSSFSKSLKAYMGLAKLDSVPMGVHYVDELLQSGASRYGEYVSKYMTTFVRGTNTKSDGLLMQRRREV
jgi:hypothetical protein